LVNRVDLHAHSSQSDGTEPPARVVALAREAGLWMLALTDHDTMAGVAEALAAAGGPVDLRAVAAGEWPPAPPGASAGAAPGASAGDSACAAGVGPVGASEVAARPLALIPGVEFSTAFRKELHILGYFAPGRHEAILPFVAEARRERESRNERVLAKLRALGMNVTREQAAAESAGETFGRPHIALAMVRAGYATSRAAAFREFLAEGRKAYAPREGPTPERCVEAIREAGGLAVIAHPVQIGIPLGQARELARSLAARGLWGVEAFYPDNGAQDTANYVALAGGLGLAATGGSDFHGANRPGVALGAGKGGNLRVPASLMARLAAALLSAPGAAPGTG
jgi:predicted metal-dependent phosphoesterase TrpH